MKKIKVKIVGDSKLVILQMEGHYALKKPTFAPYRATVQKLMQRFDEVEIIHRPRSDKRFPDALAMLGAKMEFNEGKIAVEIVKRTDSSVIEQVDEEQAIEGWQEKLVKQLTTREGDVLVLELAQFTMVMYLGQVDY
ncbi:hypothetical protein Vadar_018725 [Vaccinium darrowii]|uniref:Uncharacterized protein n=1 Tax=Vaccinium darrowii TaxID=229202 RepID=A0ACB7YEJ3_9ERIC|nr:hypothetical protein Vadar_018725 [Vaccinium darrowii]